MVPILTMYKRFRRAYSLGFKFIRTKNFNIPSSLIFQNLHRNLALPNNGTYIELFRDIVLDDEYYLQVLKKKNIKTIVDIGANLGIFAIASRIYFPSSVIHSYEPNHQNMAYLKKNSIEFDFELYNEAVSSKPGKANLKFSTEHDTAATIKICDDGLITVSSLNNVLNRFEGKKVDLLKLDCEGAEYEILKNNNALKNVRFLTLEYHLPENRSDEKLIELYKILSDQNFSIMHESRRNVCLGNILAKNDIQ